jgi:hypothetical protein
MFTYYRKPAGPVKFANGGIFLDDTHQATKLPRTPLSHPASSLEQVSMFSTGATS